LSNLTHLYLYNNQLTALSPELGKLNNLTELGLTTPTDGAAPELGELRNLTELGLDNNQLTVLPQSLVN